MLVKHTINRQDIDLRIIAERFLGEGKRAGKAVMYPSPFRDDGKRASFAVYADGYHDFGGSHESGDAIDFVQRMLNCSFQEALAYLNLQADNAPMSKRKSHQQKINQPPDAAWQSAMYTFVLEAHWRLLQNPDAMRYLRQERGLSDETIRRYQLGYNAEWTDTGYRDEHGKVKAAPGIVIPWLETNDDTANQPIIYAVRVRSITGSLAKALKKPDETYFSSKYISVRGSRPSVGLFGADNLQAGCDVLFVEGEFDAMLANQHGLLPAVTRGSASDHHNLDTRWCERLALSGTVYALMDDDEAGQSALQALADQLSNPVKQLMLPKGKDITEYLVQKRGSMKAIARQLANAPIIIGTMETKPTTDGPSASDCAMSEWAQPVTLETLPANEQANLRYISDTDVGLLMLTPTILVKSPIGTGKTALVKGMIDHLRAHRHDGSTPSILVITHLQALARDIAKRLELDNYDDLKDVGRTLKRNYLAEARQVVISYDSLHLLQKRDYDLVVIDEQEQFHRHLQGDTFQKGAAAQAYDTLRQIVHQAGHFVALDAHLSEISVKWAKSLRPNKALWVLENTYQHDWGELVVHAHEETLIERAFAVADENKGAVVIPTSSKARSDVYYEMAVQRYGAAAVMLINSANSATRDAQALIRDINAELPKLRMLICSPSLATGIDVQAPVRGVFGIFFSQPITPTSMVQMMGRCRNASERHVYVQTAYRNLETDWRTLYDWHLQRAQRTGDKANFAKQSIKALTPVQQSILALQSAFMAQANRQFNDPFSYFVALAKHEGYDIQYHDERHNITRDWIRQTKQDVDMRTKQDVLESAPITRDVYEQHRRNGTLTPAIRAGYTRWLIEDCAGQVVDEMLYDDLHKPAGRQALRRFTDLLEDIEVLQARDRQQASENHLIIKRGHFTATRDLVWQALTCVFGDNPLYMAADDVAIEVTADDIETRLDTYKRLHLHDIQIYLDRRCDLSTASVSLLRRLCKRVGLKLVSRQVMREGKRFMLYRLCANQLALQIERAMARLAYLDAKAQAEETGQTAALLQTRNTVSDIRDCSNGVTYQPSQLQSQLQSVGFIGGGEANGAVANGGDGDKGAAMTI